MWCVVKVDRRSWSLEFWILQVTCLVFSGDDCVKSSLQDGDFSVVCVY